MLEVADGVIVKFKFGISVKEPAELCEYKSVFITDKTCKSLPPPNPVAVPEQVAFAGNVTLPDESNVIASAEAAVCL